MGSHSAASVLFMIEAMRLAYLDRNIQFGDPAFIKNPTGKPMSKDYAASIGTLIADCKTRALARKCRISRVAAIRAGRRYIRRRVT
jgi:gamma-glutamyltranspeptidase